jgi:hypothetical protein
MAGGYRPPARNNSDVTVIAAAMVGALFLAFR